MKRLLRLAIRCASYPTLLANRLMCALGVWRRWNVLDEHVLIGGLPTRGDVERLAAAGVGAVINLCEEFDGHERDFARRGLAYLRLPTLDYHSPAVADLERGVAFIERHARDGRRVYVHCKAGRKRSAVLALCWLIASRGLTPDEAAAELRRARPHVDRGLERLETVQAFYRLRGGRSGGCGAAG